MRETYGKLYRIENKGITNTTCWWKLAFTDTRASLVLEMERDQESVGEVDELFRF